MIKFKSNLWVLIHMQRNCHRGQLYDWFLRGRCSRKNSMLVLFSDFYWSRSHPQPLKKTPTETGDTWFYQRHLIDEVDTASFLPKKSFWQIKNEKWRQISPQLLRRCHSSKHFNFRYNLIWMFLSTPHLIITTRVWSREIAVSLQFLSMMLSNNI